jgi:hypothetical protein
MYNRLYGKSQVCEVIKKEKYDYVLSDNTVIR